MKSRHLFAALAAGLMATTAGAGPRVTETADALPARDCELEAAATRDRASGAPTVRGTEVVLGCGVGASTQINAGWTRESSEGAHASGYGLVGKTTFVMPEAGRIGWGVAYGIAAARSGSGSLRWQQAAVSLVATRELAGSWLLHANLGVGHERESRQNSTLWSLGVESTDTLALAADVFGDDRNRPWASAGVGYSFGGGFSASVRVAQQFEQPRLRSVTLGLKLVF